MRGTDCSLNHRSSLPPHDVAMGVDEPGQRRHALGIDGLNARGGRRAWGDRHDAAVAHDDRAAVDRGAAADDDARVRDDQVLCRRRSGNGKLQRTARTRRMRARSRGIGFPPEDAGG